jgi:hypothetical protein
VGLCLAGSRKAEVLMSEQQNFVLMMVYVFIAIMGVGLIFANI